LRQQWRDADQIAEELSNKIVFKINNLLQWPKARTGICPSGACVGAAVELSSRTGPAFADD
jgi:hypothetical protein